MAGIKISRSFRTDYINDVKFPQRQGDRYQVLRLGTESVLYWDTIPVHDSNVITVSKEGSPSTIEEALALCTGASAENPFVVNVSPGIYEENELTIPSYVSLVGTEVASTIIRPNGNHTCINLSPHSYLYLMSLEGTNGDQQTGINVIDCDVYSLVFKVSVTNMNIGMEVIANTVDSELYCEYIDFSECTTHGVHIHTSIMSNFVNFDDSYIFAPVASALETCLEVHGTMSEFNCENLFIVGYTTSGTMSGVAVKEGGVLFTRNMFIRGCDIGLDIPADGGTPTVKIGNIIFDNNLVLDVSCPNPTAIGYFAGITSFDKISINDNASFFQYGRDLQIVTVKKKGGDFLTITAALASITDASATKRYIIDVGSGIFVENPITMKSHVSIIGQSSTFSVIQSADNDSNLITGIGNSEIRRINLIGPTNAGRSTVFYDGDATGGQFSMNELSFGTANILVTINSTDGDSLAFIGNCDMPQGESIVYGIRINSTGGNVATIHINNNNFNTDASLVKCIEIDGESVVQLHDTYLVASGAGIGIEVINCDIVSTGNVLLDGMVTGINVPNTANTPYLNIWDVLARNCTMDVNVANSNTTGIVNGKLERTKCSISADTLTLNITGDTGLTITGDLYAGSTFNRTTNLTKSIQYSSNIGLTGGGTMSTIGVLTTRVTTGTGYLTVGAVPNEYLQYTSWIQTDLVLPTNSLSYIYVNTAGTVLSSTTVPTPLVTIILGAVYTTSDILYYQRTPRDATYTSSKADRLLRDALGTIVQNGLICTINGVNDKRLDVTSGKYWYSVTSYEPSGGVAITYTQIYRAVVGYTITSGLTDVNCTQYDDGSGVLQNIPATRFAKHALYLVGEGADERYFVVIGQETFISLAAAEAGSLPMPPTFFNENTITVAGIVVEHDANNIAETVDIRPTIAFRSGTQTASSDHNSLSNLTVGNPHTQYLLASGATPLVGNLNLNSNALNNVTSLNLVNTNIVTVQANAATATYTLTLPTTDGNASQALTTDGSGGLSWASYLLDPLTTNEDLLIRRLGVSTRMGVGSNGTRLGVFSVAGVTTVGYYLPIEPRREFYFYDDFIGNDVVPYGDTNWHNAGTILKDPLAGTNMVGHIMLRSGTTRTVVAKASGTSLFTGGIVLGNGLFTIEVGVYINLLLDTADAGDIITIGLGNDTRANTLTAQQNGIYFNYFPSLYAAHRWSIHAVNSDVITNADSGVNVTAGTFYRLKIVATNATSIAYYINDTLVGTIVTNIPTTGITPLIRTRVGATPTVDSLHVDYVMCHYIFTTTR